ncbi:MAG: HD domain-containing protein [Lachnospiraceae bacterium]|nr:HD domain-containing protein [Lachnospiraceae bacterium]
MQKEQYTIIENYMLSCMEKDTAHDKEHVYRVLCTALDIAQTEENVNYDVLICACLLHDIGRQKQLENPKLCHAQVGAEKACQFLRKHGFCEDFCMHVKECIQTHRYRKGNPPDSIKAKILFDADKIDVSGAVGLARTLAYKGQHNEPLYSRKADGSISDGTNDAESSFFQEHKYKLEHIYDKFYTTRGAAIAKQRQSAAISFYNSMLQEIRSSYESGIQYASTASYNQMHAQKTHLLSEAKSSF